MERLVQGDKRLTSFHNGLLDFARDTTPGVCDQHSFDLHSFCSFVLSFIVPSRQPSASPSWRMRLGNGDRPLAAASQWRSGNITFIGTKSMTLQEMLWRTLHSYMTQSSTTTRRTPVVPRRRSLRPTPFSTSDRLPLIATSLLEESSSKSPFPPRIFSSDSLTNWLRRRRKSELPCSTL